MAVLVICDDYWHPASTVRAGLEPLKREGWMFDWIEDAADWSAERMAGYPAVLLAKSNNVSSKDQTNWMSEAVQQAFVDYVRRGNGLLAVHSGTAGYQETHALRALLGGVFLKHPQQCPVSVCPREDKPLAAGCEPFTLLDEHYFMALDDPRAEVFIRTVSEHGGQPGGWTRAEGQGRVCVLTPGHNAPVWLHPSFQALLRNALSWCSGRVAEGQARAERGSV